MVAHCFFEQSGVFKNEFKKLGIAAYDYDIRNDFGETDYQIDLFNEINKAYDGNVSVFDSISDNDLVFAFFPCIRFEDQIILHFKGKSFGLDSWNNLQKLEYDLSLHKELSYLYEMVTKLAIVCLKKYISLIIENPYSPQHYLCRYWSLESVVVDRNRSDWGDYFIKPTQYWFINFNPRYNLIMDEPLVYNKVKTIKRVSNIVERSLFSPDYARKFIRTYLCS